MNAPLRQALRQRILSLGLRPHEERNLLEELEPVAEEIFLAARQAGASENEAIAEALTAVPESTGFARSKTNPLADLRHATRLYLRQPALFAAAATALALGIGAATALFSTLEAVVLRPLPYRHPDELVLLAERHESNNQDNVVAPANLLEWQRRTKLFAQVSPVISLTRHLQGAGQPISVGIEGVAWDYLRLLGVQPLLGRDFTPEDDRLDTPAAALLSHRLWQKHFQSDPNAAGRRIWLDKVETVIAGVLPPDFHSLGEEPDLLTTARLDPERDYRRQGRFLRAVARLAPGVTVAHAQAKLNEVARELANEQPAFNRGWTVNVTWLQDHFSQRARQPVFALLAAVLLLYAIVLGNVAQTLVGRAAEREREFAIRHALGAPPQRLMAQMLTESALLAVTGATVGTALAFVFIKLIQTYAPFEVPRLANAGLNATVLGFVALATAAATILCAWVPAQAALRVNPADALKDAARTLTGNRWGRAWRSAFAVTQIALATVLLIGAASLVTRFRQTLTTNPGFDARHVLTFDVTRIAPAALEQRLRQIPEIEAIGAIARLPFTGPNVATTANGQTTDVAIATPGYFAALRIPLKQGRLWDQYEPSGFVVNETFAQRQTLGTQLTVNMADHDQPAPIIGVVGDIRHQSLTEAPRPTVYYHAIGFPLPVTTMAVRSSADPQWLARQITGIVNEANPGLPVANLRPLDEWIGRSLATQRFTAALLGVFALLALAVALFGIHGTLSQTIAERRHEIGVRLALGADSNDIVRFLARHGATVIAVGLALGVLSAPLAVDIHWPTTAAALAATVVFASGIIVAPAVQAGGLDPTRVLRQE